MTRQKKSGWAHGSDLRGKQSLITKIWSIQKRRVMLKSLYRLQSTYDIILQVHRYQYQQKTVTAQ